MALANATRMANVMGEEAQEGRREVQLRCVHRRGTSSSIERVGVLLEGQVRHFHPASVVFALKTGRWRLLARRSETDAQVEVTAGCDHLGRDTLMVTPGDLWGAELVALCADHAY